MQCAALLLYTLRHEIMIVFARIVPAFLAGLLLGAHFLRGGHLLITAACLFFPAVLFARRDWARRAVQCFLGFGACVWLFTAVRLINYRLANEQDWLRLALILAAVAAVNLLAAGLLEGRRMRRWFRLKESQS